MKIALKLHTPWRMKGTRFPQVVHARQIGDDTGKKYWLFARFHKGDAFEEITVEQGNELYYHEALRVDEIDDETKAAFEMSGDTMFLPNEWSWYSLKVPYYKGGLKVHKTKAPPMPPIGFEINTIGKKLKQPPDPDPNEHLEII